MAFYQYILGTSMGLSIIGALQGIMSLAGITAGMEQKLKNKIRILIGLIGNALFLYSILMFEPFRVILKISEPNSITTYIPYLILGCIIILAGFFYGNFAKDDNIIIRMFNQLSTKTD